MLIVLALAGVIVAEAALAGFPAIRSGELPVWGLQVRNRPHLRSGGLLLHHARQHRTKPAYMMPHKPNCPYLPWYLPVQVRCC